MDPSVGPSPAACSLLRSGCSMASMSECLQMECVRVPGQRAVDDPGESV